MNMIEGFKELVDDFTEKANKFITQQKEKEKQPPVTGRPFSVVNEPEEGQNVYFMEFNGYVSVAVYCKTNNWYTGLLMRGLLYPTEASCIFGEKQKEVQAFYRAMGDGFEPNGQNWSAHYSHWSKCILIDDDKIHQTGAVVFRTIQRCQSAIDAVNERFGAGAFETYVLEVGSNG